MESAAAEIPDRSSNILRSSRQTLDKIFAPKTVAVIGATEAPNSVGRTVLWNLISNPFGGTVFPVNPKRPSVLGIKAYPTIKDVPEQVDLAVVVTRAPLVPQIIAECVEAEVPGAIVISAGFKEMGPEGAKLEQEILKAAQGKIRIIGPNCLGVMNPLTGLNATFAAGMARPGNVAFISQSGALCTAILDWSFQERVGFSAFVSIGSMLDIGWGDLISYLGDDPRTQSILLYMESLGDARSFLSAAREVAMSKPIIVIKAGRSAEAAKAAASHTGALAGSDKALDAAFRRAGVLRVNRISELFFMAEVLSRQPRPRGPRLTIVTNAGGPGVLATDALIEAGCELTKLSDETIAALNEFLPPHWSRGNPIDVLGDADPERYAKALETAAKDPNADGLLVILTPQDMTDPTMTAETLKAHARIPGKPVIASWMGGAQVAAGRDILHRAQIPNFDFCDTAARVFAYMWRYSYNLRGLYETPSLPPEDVDGDVPDRAKAAEIIERVRSTGRTLLTEVESKELLAAYGIPTVETRIARSVDEAVQHAEAIGYPVVLKIYSETITHKTDVGGVKLNLKDADAVRAAYQQIQQSVTERAGAEHFQGVTVQPMIKMEGYELIVGSTIDEQLGPVVLFGSGGQLVEVYQDQALALPPLNDTLARRLMEQTKVYKALKGVRGRKPVDQRALEQLLVHFSHLVVEQKWIKECDINPLLASSEQIVAVDARVVLHPPEVTEDQLPRPAIRPYPRQYVSEWTLKDGTRVTIRPIMPQDEPLMVKFHESLSERTVQLRYFHPFKLSERIAHDRLARVCFVDYDRQLVLVAERKDPQTGERQILGVGRVNKVPGTTEGEFAVLIADAFQRKGLGTRMLQLLVEYGQREGLTRIFATMLPENIGMRRVAEKVGFKLERSLDAPEIRASIDLPVPAASSGDGSSG